jgi:hypothetical protein
MQHSFEVLNSTDSPILQFLTPSRNCSMSEPTYDAESTVYPFFWGG